jgi:hypothetical protein
MKQVALVAMSLFLAICGGCATALRGDAQKIRFETEPAGATVKVDNQTYTTPVQMKLKRNENHDVVVSKDGYRTVMFTMIGKWDGASIPGAALPGGSVSVAADRATGADLSFYEVPKIKLEPAASGAPPLQLIQYNKKYLPKDEYEKALKEDQEEAFRLRR